jgi:hypothetical protein
MTANDQPLDRDASFLGAAGGPHHRRRARLRGGAEVTADVLACAEARK